MQKQKNNKRFYLLLGLGLLFSAGFASIALGVVLSKKSSSSPTSFPFSKDKIVDKNESKYDQLISLGSVSYKDVGYKNRKIQTKSYKTEMLNKYSQYGFKYPGWNNNYEQNGTRYINYNGQNLDMCSVLLDERVIDDNGKYVLNDNNEKIKYNDAYWIQNEIKTGNFRKHPAADVWFERNVTNDTLSVERKFVFSANIRGPISLGLYAPAGEIIELEFDDDTWELMKASNWKGMSISINQNFWDSYPADNSARISNRYPYLRTYFGIDLQNKIVKFGSPFGGNISINIDNPFTNNSIYKSYNDLKFSVRNAVETLYYVDGFTTEKEWNNQIEKVKNGKINAPSLGAVSNYGTINMPYTGKNEIGHYSIDQMVYPKETFKKLNDFLFLSNYFANNDSKEYLYRLDFEFCDDIWGGAAAWGGGNRLYCEPTWGMEMLFLGSENPNWWSMGDQWGTFHEMNHNFQQDSAFFKLTSKMHPQTNQVTVFNLAIQGDKNRFRSETNWYGENVKGNRGPGWRRLSNAFSNIQSANLGYGGPDEYSLYAAILHTIGFKSYVEYVRWDSVNHSNGAQGWTHMGEIQTMSEKFGLNLWPAIEQMTNRYWKNDSPFWVNDNDPRWPLNYEVASSEEKQIIDNLNKNYPAIDFVANLYASGAYKYDYKTKTFVYTDDTCGPMDIIAGEPKELDFENFIISMNEKFDWSNLEFNAKTKLGGTLKISESSDKKLIYIPNKNKINEIDEFDVSISPKSWINKPTNYVPKYKWKIKIRQNVHTPIFSLYEPFASGGESDELFKQLDQMNPKAKWIFNNFNSNGFDTQQTQGMKFKFKFIAPKDGTYIFQNTWDDMIRMKVNGQLKFKSNNWTNKWTETYQIDMKENEIIDLEFAIINNSGVGGFDCRIIDKNSNKSVNVFNHSLNESVDKLNLENSVLNYYLKEEYQYKEREVDYNYIKSDNLTNFLNVAPVRYEEYPTSDYVITSKYSKNVNEQLKENDGNYFELWNKDGLNNACLSEFVVTFNKVSKVKSMLFGHRTNNHYQSRAQTMKITITNKDNQTLVIYNGAYGAQFNDRSKSESIFVLDKEYEVKSMKFEFSNSDPYGGLIFNYFRISSNNYSKIQKILTLNNKDVVISNNWVNVINDLDFNVSAVNNSSWYSNKKDNSIKFRLENSSGFAIVGRGRFSDGLFDVYINGKKVGTSDQLNEGWNQNLFQYFNSSKNQMEVELKTTSNNQLFLNYILVFD